TINLHDALPMILVKYIVELLVTSHLKRKQFLMCQLELFGLIGRNRRLITGLVAQLQSIQKWKKNFAKYIQKQMCSLGSNLILTLLKQLAYMKEAILYWIIISKDYKNLQRTSIFHWI